MFEQPISDNNFILFAMHHYDNPQCTSIAEFEEDLKRFGYLRKLFVRYKENDDLRERLIINHIIVLFNLFGIAAVELLFFKMDRQYWDILATFLVYLDRMPQEIPEFNIKTAEVQLDEKILNILRSL